MHSGVARFVLYLKIIISYPVFLTPFFWSASFGGCLSVHQGWIFIAGEYPILGLDQTRFQFGAVMNLFVCLWLCEYHSPRFTPGEEWLISECTASCHAVSQSDGETASRAEDEGPPASSLPQHDSWDFWSFSVFMNNEVENLLWFGFLEAYWMSSFMKCLFETSLHFIIEMPVFSSLICRSCP